MEEILGLGLMLIGAIFIFIAAIGLLRLPDLFMRMHANTKSATMGVGLIMIGTAIHFGEITVTTRSMAVVIFLLITAPIGSHLLARAAYFSGIPLWEHTLSDDLRGHYDLKTHELHGEDLTGPKESSLGENL
jgi:multicomponent Na+:H+ antiporter subunit G